MRPCYINDSRGAHICKAMFHCWTHEAEIVERSVLGSYPGGVIESTLGIVEYEDGTVHKFNPERIQFIKEATDDVRNS